MGKKKRVSKKKGVNVAFAVCAYDRPEHLTFATTVEMSHDFARFCERKGHGWGFIGAWKTLLCGAREGCVAAAKKDGFDYLLFLDGDMVFPGNTARVLVETALKYDMSVVGGLYCTRHPPYRPLIYVENPLKKGEKRPSYCQWLPKKYGTILECDAMGFGCTLLRLDLFDEVGKPWFRLDSKDEDGTAYTEDVFFFRKVRALGIPIYVHTGVICGHIGPGGMVIPTVGAPYPNVNHPTIDALAWIKKHTETGEIEVKERNVGPSPSSAA